MTEPESIDSAQTLQRAGSGLATPRVEVLAGEARYEPLGLIGEGGMGRVLEAVDRQFSRVVAIKELRDPKADPARFLVEAMVTGNLEHPGVPPVYERGTRADGSPYYVMRRVRGRSLEDALLEAGELPARLALLPAVTRAAQTLGFAHEKGVVHRDVKPQNILVGTHGEVFVVDWGLARVGQVPSSSGGTGDSLSSRPNETMAGSVMGTPAYMPPEQARGDIALVDARTDVFALGAVLYRLLAGKPPYEGASSEQALDRARRASFSPIDEAAPGAPEPLRAICRKAMAARPEDRFSTAQHLADALEHFASDAVHLAFEPGANRTAKFAAWVVGIASVGGLVSLTQISFDIAFGPHLLFGATFLGVSMSLAYFEARSRGRLGLGPLGYALSGGIFLSGVIGSGFQVLLEYDGPQNVAKGIASAMLSTSVLCIISLLVWGLVLRKRVR